MKTSKKQTLLAAVGLMAITGAAQGATVLSTDFTGVTTTDATDTVGNITWDTVAGVDAPASTLVIAESVAFFSSTNLVKVDYNLVSVGSFSFTIEDLSLNAGTSSIDLTALSLDLDAITGSGSEQDNNRDLTVGVEVIGSISGSLGSDSTTITESGANDAGTSPTTYLVDLSALASLSASETYDVVVTISSPGTEGVNAQFDTLVLTGDITPVPEPGSLALLGLGGLLIGARRRRG